jgi:hypothetical protein
MSFGTACRTFGAHHTDVITKSAGGSRASDLTAIATHLTRRLVACRRGHLRTNAAGRNLNREWESPCEEDSPEVYHLLKMMDKVGGCWIIGGTVFESMSHNWL